MPKLLRSLTAEFVGTLLFVFLGAGSVVAFIANGPTTGSIGPLGVALAHGVGMAVIVSMTMGLALVGTPRLATEVGFMQGVWIEALLTFFLVSAVFGTAVSSEAPKIAGFGIGLAIFVDALVGGSFTGAMMNPARAIGPALVAWQWDAHAVY